MMWLDWLVIGVFVLGATALVLLVAFLVSLPPRRSTAHRLARRAADRIVLEAVLPRSGRLGRFWSNN